jgi:hypothetical protein
MTLLENASLILTRRLLITKILKSYKKIKLKQIKLEQNDG